LVSFSAQVNQTGSGTTSVDIWLRQNGVDVPNSNVRGEVLFAGDAELVSETVVLSFSAGDTLQFVQTVSTAGRGAGIYTIAPVGEPVIPSITVAIAQIN
jgi:hypothetical protein